MKSPGLKWYFSFFLLLLFLGSKGLEYHPMSHSDENSPNGCELCEFAIIGLETPYTPAEVPSLSASNLAEIEVRLPEARLKVFTGRLLPIGQFCRPPPSTPLA